MFKLSFNCILELFCIILPPHCLFFDLAGHHLVDVRALLEGELHLVLELIPDQCLFLLDLLNLDLEVAFYPMQ